MIEALAPQFRTFVIDQRGWGGRRLLSLNLQLDVRRGMVRAYAAMIAARFPDKVNSLVLAGAPIDANAGNGPIKQMAQKTPLSFYADLVALGGGLMKGKFMLQGWKNMHPAQHYMQDQIDLC